MAAPSEEVVRNATTDSYAQSSISGYTLSKKGTLGYWSVSNLISKGRGCKEITSTARIILPDSEKEGSTTADGKTVLMAESAASMGDYESESELNADDNPTQQEMVSFASRMCAH